MAYFNGKRVPVRVINIVEVDSELSTTSENPVQNKVITAELQDISTKVLPEVTADENGKTIQVVDGAWAMADAAQGSEIVLDTTMTQAGQAADAKAVGDMFNGAMTEITGALQLLNQKTVALENQAGDIEAALDSIIAMQNNLIGGGA